MKNYEKQAQDFLKKTKTTMTARITGHDKYFPGDKQARNIYEITLRRNNNEYIFTFGQGINDTEAGNEPTAYDILSCLTKYEVGDFKGFCADYGYNDDSISAYDIYKKVLDEWENVNRLFSDVLEELREIE
ncbi:hypothetical protein M0R04_09375 [Candidatus Dojkabacteria bacterium]|jgi:hypothetical protein|nr:hypothetical protein [Candidatus Dojkabacteria bacterium]